jgi:hypothetical protein
LSFHKIVPFLESLTDGRSGLGILSKLIDHCLLEFEIGLVASVDQRLVSGNLALESDLLPCPKDLLYSQFSYSPESFNLALLFFLSIDL